MGILKKINYIFKNFSNTNILRININLSMKFRRFKRKIVNIQILLYPGSRMNR